MKFRIGMVAIGFAWSVLMLCAAGMAQECAGGRCALRPVVASSVVAATAPVAKVRAVAVQRVATWSPRRWLRRR